MRLYLTNASHPTNPTISGQASGWNNTPGNVKNFLSPNKSGANAAITLAETSTTNPTTMMVRRFLALPFLRAGNFDPTDMFYALARVESNAAMNAKTRFSLTVHGTNGVARAVVGTWSLTGGVEWPTVLSAVGGTLSGGAVVAVVAGEYLSLEVGYIAENVIATSYSGTIRAGGTDATDLVNGDTATNSSSRSPWVEFPAATNDDLWVAPPPDVSAGGGASFDAESDGMSVQSPPASTFTMTGWIKVATDRNAFSTFCEIGDGTEGAFLQMALNNEGMVGGFSQVNAAVTTYEAPVGSWVCVVVTRTPTTLTVSAGLTPGARIMDDATAAPTWTPLAIDFAWSDAWPGEHFLGHLASFKFWSGVVLTEAEILEELAYYRAVRKTSLHAEYFMQGMTLTDYSGNGRTLTAGSTPAVSVVGPAIPYEKAVAANPDQNNYFQSVA